MIACVGSYDTDKSHIISVEDRKYKKSLNFGVSYFVDYIIIRKWRPFEKRFQIPWSRRSADYTISVNRSR